MFFHFRLELMVGCVLSLLLTVEQTVGQALPSVQQNGSLVQQGGAQQSSIDQALPLQQRVIALNQAIELRCGNDLEKLKVAKQRLAQTLDAWNQLNAPTEMNKHQLQNWLTLSMRAMMQGRSDKIPPPLFFAGAEAENESNEFRIVETGPKLAEPSLSNENLNQGAKRSKRRVAKPIQKQQERSRWSQHPSSAPLKWKDSFEGKTSSNETLEDPFRESRPTKYEVRRPFIDNTVSVNHSELIAAIRGFNLEVKNVNRRLQRVNELSVAHLLKIADDLERLWNEKAFLSLYIDGLTEETRRIMPRPLSAELAKELVLRHAADLLASESLKTQADRAALQGLNLKLSQYK